MAQENTKAEEAFERSLAFLGGLLFLYLVALEPFAPSGTNLGMYAAKNGVIFLLTVSLYATALRLAWHLVGGKATVRSFFVTYAYFFSVVSVALGFFILLSVGVFKSLEPTLYAQCMPTIDRSCIDLFAESFPNSLALKVSVSIFGVGFAILSLWSFVAWGAYRELNALSKWRSFLALLITGVLAWPIVLIVSFIGQAIIG